MNDTIQSVIIGAVVLAAVIYLARRSRKSKGCGKGDCGCAPKQPPGRK